MARFFVMKKNKKRIEFNLGWTYFCVVHINGSGEWSDSEKWMEKSWSIFASSDQTADIPSPGAGVQHNTWAVTYAVYRCTVCTVLYSVQGNVILVVTSQCTADHRPARSRTHRPADNHLPAGQSLVTLGPGFTANKFCSLSVNLVNFDLSNTSKQTWCVKHLNGFYGFQTFFSMLNKSKNYVETLCST